MRELSLSKLEVPPSIIGVQRAFHDVMKLCIIVGTTVGGWVGWALAENLGLMMAFLASSVGSVLGVYLGWRVARRLLE